MPAEFENGVFTENKPAWHGAGVVLPDDAVTIERVLELVPELASDVVQRDVFAAGAPDDVFGTSRRLPIPGAVANVREYDEKVLGIVSNRYKILQNRDAFQFGADILDTGGASIKTAGTLHGGSQAWFLLKIDKDVRIGGREDERIETYLLISNSHDGKSAVKAATVTVRVVCSNTLAFALNTARRVYSFSHVTGVEERVQQARGALDLTFRYADALAEVGESLINQHFPSFKVDQFLADVFPVSDVDSERAEAHAQNKRDAVKRIYTSADNIANIRGTKWGLLQAVTEWDTHHAAVRSSRNNTREQARFARSVNNSGVSQRALELLQAA